MLTQYAVRPLLVLVALTALFDQCVWAADLFPDKNLEAVVRQYVFAKRGKKEPLVAADVEKLSTIKGNGKGIANLAGLEKYVSLAALDLAGNEITDLTPIKDLTKLQTLTLSKNKISNVAPLAKLTALQYLELSNKDLQNNKLLRLALI